MVNFLENLKREQIEIAQKIRIPKFSYGLSFFKFIVGVDLAFLNKMEALVCFAIFDGKKVSYLWKKNKVNFPYIPTFLAFRELPLINDLLSEISLPSNTLFFIDGHGISHPRRAGIATHFGVSNDLISIGLAKKLLFGTIKNNGHRSYVVDGNNDIIAYVLNFQKKVMGSNQLFLSIGNNINLINAFFLFSEIIERYGIIPTKLAHDFLQKLKKGFVKDLKK